MNELIKEEHYEEQLYQILGNESQVLQLILMPNQQIITNETSIQYMSDQIQLKEKYTLRERFKQIFTGQRKLDFIVENQSGSIGYIGLTQNSGRIIIIDPDTVGSCFVQEHYVLAHTNSVDLVMNNSFEGKHLLQGKQYFQIITKNDMHRLYEHFLKDESDTIKPLAAQFNEQNKVQRELLFLHSHENLIEKTLGEDETMFLHIECLIGFSDSVSIQAPSGKVISTKDFVSVKGPGIVYIETSNQKETFFSKNFSRREVTR